MRNSHLFKEISVWKQIDDDNLIRYRCFQVLPDNRYVVKSAHYYSYPIEPDDEQFKQAEFYFLDSMFQGGLLEITNNTYETLEEAIAAHDEDFAN
jgi:hypothetical protein